MIQVTPQMRVLVAVEPVDFRRGIDGLSTLCRAVLHEEPMSGVVFVFRSRSRKAIKLLVCELPVGVREPHGRRDVVVFLHDRRGEATDERRRDERGEAARSSAQGNQELACGATEAGPDAGRAVGGGHCVVGRTRRGSSGARDGDDSRGFVEASRLIEVIDVAAFVGAE